MMKGPSAASNDPLYAFGPFVADPVKGILERNGSPVVLAAKSFEVLMALIEGRDQIVEKDDLLKLVWQGDAGWRGHAAR